LALVDRHTMLHDVRVVFMALTWSSQEGGTAGTRLNLISELQLYEHWTRFVGHCYVASQQSTHAQVCKCKCAARSYPPPPTTHTHTHTHTHTRRMVKICWTHQWHLRIARRQLRSHSRTTRLEQLQAQHLSDRQSNALETSMGTPRVVVRS
jgi:hypothetical protein